jgi:uncharacterized protein YerC
MQVAVETRRVLFPCGRKAAVVVSERLTRKGGVVRKFVQDATVEAVPLIDTFAEEARQTADYVDLVIASVQTPAKPITVVARPKLKYPYSHGTVCGGTSVKTTNRIERCDWYGHGVSKKVDRQERLSGWKFEERRKHKAWRWKAKRRKSIKIELENREILLSQ